MNSQFPKNQRTPHFQNPEFTSRNPNQTQSLFTQKTPKPKKSKFFKITTTIALAIVAILLYKTFASTGVNTASNISLNYDTNTIKENQGKIECIEDDRILQWHEGLEMWECKKPTSAIFGELDKNNVKVNSSGSLECKEDNKTLIWDDNQWNCGDPENNITTENGLSIDSNDQLSIDSPTCSSNEKLIWDGNSFKCEEDQNEDKQTLSFTDNVLSILNGNDIDLSDYDNSEDLEDHVDDDNNPHSTNFLNLTDTPDTYTQGSILFTSNSSVTQDNTNLFWDDVNKRLGVGTNTPVNTFEVANLIKFNDATGTTILGSGAGVNLDPSASYNTFIGRIAGAGVTTGVNNTFVGALVGYQTTTGSNNATLGVGTLQSNTTGSSNVCIGKSVMKKSVDKSYNVGIGENALRDGGGTGNVAIGHSSMQVTGDEEYNVAIGYQSGIRINGNDNLVLGRNSGYDVVGSDNILIGRDSGYYLNGSNNIILGMLSGNGSGYSGSSNILIGNDIELPATTSSNTLNIGNLIFGESIDGTGTIISSGNIGIGLKTPTAKLHTKGTTSDSSSYALKVDDSSNTSLLSVRNDGLTTLSGVTVQGTFSSAPTGIEGGIYYNSTDKHFYGHNGTTWVQLDN